MTRWAPFLGLAVTVVATLLLLARLSQGLTSDGAADDRRPDPGRRPAGAVGDPRFPRVESPSAARDHARAREPPALRAREADLSTGALLANVALTQGLFGGVLLAGAWYFEVPAAAFGVANTPITGGALGVAVGAALGVVLWGGNEAAGRIADAAGVGYDESLRELLAPDGPVGWLLLLGLVFPTVAFVEEFVFRAALIGAAAVGTPIPAPALAVLSSVAFGAAHGAQGRVGVVVTGSLGLVLAGAFLASGSLLVVVVAHYLVNSLELIVHEGI